jgi:hypothetical protein
MKAQCIAAVLLLSLGNVGAFQGAVGNKVTPIEKVITLLEDLKTSVEDEAKEEATTYDKFACFCKDNTVEKSDAITEGQVNIDDTSATIGEKTAALAEKENELAELKKQINTLKTDIAAAEAQRAKEKAEYEMVIADLEKALTSMEGAIKALEDSKPSLVQVRNTIRKAVAMANFLELPVSPKHRQVLQAFLQADSKEEPGKGEYEFQSQGIIDILKELQEDFTKNKEEKDTEEEKAVAAHEALMGEKNAMLDDAEKAKTETEEAIATLQEEIATEKENLVGLESELKDNQLYLKDLTERCEVKAKEWDQRSTMRADEITAITKALEVIKGGAAGVEAARAMLQTQDADDSSLGSATAEAKSISDHRALDIMDDDVGDLGLAFLQEKGTIRAQMSKFLEKAEDVTSTSLEARKKRALAILASEGRRLGSSLLLSTALKLGPDPFKKVKGLIQALIERLLQEMADEAGHKGFCDTELGKAKTSRDFEHEKTQKLSAELMKLEATEATLKMTIETLKEEITELYAALEKATKLRDDEKEGNEQTIKDSTEGLEAIKEAITILKEFYKEAAKALLQEKASPIDEGEGTGELAGGSYQGKQKQAEGIIGMLEVIKSDFERSVKQTTDAEAESHRNHVSFDRESKSSISTKETALSQSESDLKETEISIKEGMAALAESQKLLDDALKTVEELKPACIDTGMSYEERVAKREEEIKALKEALCMLDVEGVEAECS